MATKAGKETRRVAERLKEQAPDQSTTMSLSTSSEETSEGRSWLGRGLAAAKIPPRFINAEMAEFSKDFQAQAGSSLYIHGPRGAGKTHYLCALLKHNLRVVQADRFLSGLSCLGFSAVFFLPVPELLLQFKQSYSNPQETESNILTNYTKCPVLGLDDLGAERVSDWSIEMLYLLIDRRYREMRTTLVTSNMSLGEVAERLDDKIASRLSGMCTVIRFSGDDRRVKKQ